MTRRAAVASPAPAEVPAMTFDDPFAAYNAASNLEAHVVCDALNAAGVRAMVVEDVSNVGMSWAGWMSEIHKPQVWIDRSDVDRAKPVLDAFEEKQRRRREETADGEPVEATCEECGKTSTFPASQKGSVQDCPHCRAYMDVGDDDAIDDWDVPSEEDDERP